MRAGLAAAPLLLRGLGLHLEARLRGDPLERAISRCAARSLGEQVVLRGLLVAGQALDRVAAPGVAAITPRAPLFVVAPPRSGTTLLYRLLAADPRFVGPRLYEVVLPSVSALAALEAAAGLGERLSGGRLSARFGRWEAAMYADFDAIHRSRLRELEEDTLLFDRFLACPTAHRFFPYGERLPELVALDDRPPAVRRAVMAEYRRAIQVILHRAPPGRTYLAKNVTSFGRIASLLEAFPDARMINIVRHPYEVIPSAVHLFAASAFLNSPADERPRLPLDHPRLRLCGDAVLAGIGRLHAWGERLPPERWLTLRFDALIADPMAALRRVYDHFALPLDRASAAAIEAAAAEAAAFRSQKVERPGLEACGYRRAEVHAALRAVFDAHGFDPGPAGGR